VARKTGLTGYVVTLETYSHSGDGWGTDVIALVGSYDEAVAIAEKTVAEERDLEKPRSQRFIQEGVHIICFEGGWPDRPNRHAETFDLYTHEECDNGGLSDDELSDEED
jgi:hypothetical protein